MNADTLIAEGMRLARPSLLLSAGDATKQVVGIWGGEGVVPPPAGNWKHWLTVDCAWLWDYGLPLRGCLSLYQGSALTFVAVVDERGRLPATILAGTLLSGREELSIPPCEALDVCGSEPARLWFAAGGGADVAAAYDEEYRRRCPLWRDDVFAALGGWQTFWADSDDYESQKGKLVLWTFRDAEPWVEVWLGEAGSLWAVPRIT